MKKKFSLLALALLGMTLTSCGKTGSIGIDYDDADLDIDTPWVDYSVPVTKVTFDEGEESIVLDKGGEPHAYSYSIEPAKAMKKSLRWSSEDEEVAKVKNGVVTAVGAGETSVTVYNEENSFDPISLAVRVNVLLEDISFTQNTLAADLDHEYQLEVNYEPTDTTQTGVSWHSNNETLATVDESGLLKTNNQGLEGTVVITATSAIINKTISLTVEVADRTVYPESVVVDEYEPKVEIGHDFVMKAHSVGADPEIAVTHPEVKYHSTNPSILSVDEDSGVVHALDEGSAEIYATAQGRTEVKESNHFTVQVFEVKVANIIMDDITLSNRNGRSDVAVPLSYTTDTEGYTKASIPNFTYTVADPTIATVNDNGKLFAVADNGTTTLTVNETRSGLSKTVDLIVKYEVDSITVTGTKDILVGKNTQLNVTTSPSGIPSSMITYTSEDPSVATVNNAGLVTGVGEGTTKIAVSALGVTEKFTVSVTAPATPFSEGTLYIVGNANFSGGVSKASVNGSWDNASQAMPVLENVPMDNPPETLLYQHRAVVKFNEGDEFRLRYASGLDNGYLAANGYPMGATYKLGEFENGGAFAGTHPDMTIQENGNILVNRTGYYAIYHKQYTNDHPEGWYNIYFGRHELNISDTTPQIQVNGHATLEAHDWAGEVGFEVTEGASLITVTRGTGSENYKFLVEAGENTGTAKIVFTDDWKSVEVIVTISTEAPSQKTFEENIPYVIGNADFHTGAAVGSGNYWQNDASKAMKFVLSSEPKPEHCISQYEATITFVEDNEFQVIIGGDPVYWGTKYENDGAFANGQITRPVNEGDNAIVNTSGTYKIYVKCIEHYDEEPGGWYVYIAPKSGGGTDPTVYDFDYYLIGVGGNEQIKDEFGFTKDTSDNHYYLENVTLAVGDQIKANNPTTGEWLGVSSPYAPQSEYWKVSEANNNLEVIKAGSYTVSLYPDSFDGNYLKLDPTIEPDPIIPEYTANIGIDLSYFSGWGTVSDISLYVWTNDNTKPLGEWVACKGNLDDGSVSFTANKKVSHFIFYLTEGTEQKQSINLTCDLHESGDYHLNLDDLDWENVGTQDEPNWQMVGITIDTGAAPEPTPVTGKFKVTMDKAALASCFSGTTGGFSIYAWCNDGTEIFGEFGEGKSSAGNLDDGVQEVDFPNGKTITGAIIYLWEGSELKQSFNIELNISEPGEYVINIPSALEWAQDPEDHVYKFKTITITPKGVTPTPDPDPDPDPTTEKPYYFTNNKYWSDVYAYVWNDSTGAKPAGGDWPGFKLTKVGVNEFNQDVYAVTIDTALYDHVIFTNGSDKTEDIALADFTTNNACYIDPNDTSNPYTVIFWNRD